MSKKPIRQPKQPQKIVAKRAEAVQMPGIDLFARMEQFFDRNDKKVFWGIFILSFIFVVGLFEMKIGLANDDALYIEGAMGYANNFTGYFFKANAPLYPMFLSVLVKIFGPKLVALKLFSVIFFMVSLYFVYNAFRKRIPYTVLFAALFITATNSLFVIHASYTYTECFFAMIQSVFLFIVLKLSDKADVSGIQQTWKWWLLYGFAVMIMFLSRNVASVTAFAIIAFFLLRKQYLHAVYAFLAPVIFIGIWELVKRAVWGDEVSQFSNQGNIMRRKFLFNPADPNNTDETPWGFVLRFWHNTEIYFSARLWELVGFKKENSKIPPLDNGALILSTLFSLSLMAGGIIYALIKKNKAVLLASLYFLALCSVTFVALHIEWAQSRLVMIYLPFIFITILYGIWELFRTKHLKGFQFFFPVILLIFFLPNIARTFNKIPKNLPVLSKNLSGDEFYGYTPDWINFFKASRWCARELPEGSYVASRRAPMSFIYGDFKEFFPIYSLPSNDPDELLNVFKENKVTHVILAELRSDPNRYIPGRFISTMHRYVYAIAEKHQVFELVHTEGTVEKAEVYKIRYDLVKSDDSPESLNK